MRMHRIVLLCGLCQALKTVNKKEVDSEISADGGLFFHIEEGLSNQSNNSSVEMSLPPMLRKQGSAILQSQGSRPLGARKTSSHVAQAWAALEGGAAPVSERKDGAAAPVEVRRDGASAQVKVGEDGKSLDKILSAVKANFDQVLKKGLVDISAEGVVTLKKLKDNTIPFKATFPQKPKGTETAAAVLEETKREVAENTLRDLEELLTIVGVDKILVTGNSKATGKEKETLQNNRNDWILARLRPVLTDDLHARKGAVRGKHGDKNDMSCSIEVNTVLDVSILQSMASTDQKPLSDKELKDKMMEAKTILGKVRELLAEKEDLIKLDVNKDKTVSVHLLKIDEQIPFTPLPKKSTYTRVLDYISSLTQDQGDALTGVAETAKGDVLDTLEVLGALLTQVGVSNIKVRAYTMKGLEENERQQGLRAIITMTRATNVVKYLLFRGVNLNCVLGSEAVDAWRGWFAVQNRERWANFGGIEGVPPEAIINFWGKEDTMVAVTRRVLFPPPPGTSELPPRAIMEDIRAAVQNITQIPKLIDAGAKPITGGLLTYIGEKSLPIEIALGNEYEFKVDITITPFLNPSALEAA